MQEFYLEMLLGSTQEALLGSICAEGKESGQDWTKGEAGRGAVSAASADPTESPCLWITAWLHPASMAALFNVRYISSKSDGGG